ncbi:DUF4986 domain-containing protein [Flectobacillus roseus]
MSLQSSKNLEFIPFYKLHDSRYIIYWLKKIQN